MSALRIRSVEHPFDDPNLASCAVAALSRADAMGLLSERIERLDEVALAGLGEAITRAGIGRRFASALAPASGADPVLLTAALRGVRDALDHSPAPEFEWRAMERTLGSGLVASLVGVSEISARRYRGGVRATPDAVAARLHFLALVVGDLAGAYNDMGIRRWFDRRRSLLDGRTPAEELGGAWSPEGSGPRRVRALAHALAPLPVT